MPHALLPVLLDGHIWRSRTTESGLRRANYNVKHLVVDAHSKFSKAIEWISEARDPNMVCHPVLALVTDMIWSQAAMRSFLYGRMCSSSLSSSSSTYLFSTRPIYIRAIGVTFLDDLSR